MKSVALYGAVLVLIHLAVTLLHGQAHRELQIGLTSFQLLFVVSVIEIGPLLALALLWTQRQRFGLVLLTVSMAGAGVFGVYAHFVVPSPDHVAHVPDGYWGDLFRLTAVLLALVEAAGSILGWVWLRAQANLAHTVNAYNPAS